MFASNAHAAAALYLAYFNRPADPEGLEYWVGVLDGGASFFEVAQAFAASDEATSLYPFLATGGSQGAEMFLRAIFSNIYARWPSTEDSGYWRPVLAEGRQGWQVLGELILAASGSDISYIENKLAISLHITHRYAGHDDPYSTANARWLLNHAASQQDMAKAIAVIEGHFTPSSPGIIPDPEHDFSGDDTYNVDGPGVAINERPGGGYDTVIASISYVLPANVERLVLAGTADLDGDGNDEDNEIVGNDGNNVLRGFGGNDTLIGNAGDDTLDGGTGADRMEGGDGNDIYYVDDVGDVLVELPGEGTDTVYASIDYTLPYHVEDLVLTGSTDLNGTGNGEDNSITGNSGNNRLYGGAGNDVLIGNAGNDVLDGGTGADAMIGGSGDDTYYVDNVGDLVSDVAGGGTDTVYVSLNTHSVPDHVEIVIFNGSGSFTGYANDMGSEIRGGAWGNTLHGGNGDDRLIGGNGNDTIFGGDGDDDIYGSNGINRLSGGAGADFISLGGTTNTLVYSKNDIIDGAAGDRITGYISGLDRFEIEVPGLSTGPLTSFVDDRSDNAFQGSAGGTVTPQLILSHWNGTARDSNNYLWIDFDGSGAEGGYLIANLGTASFVTAGDIWIT